MIRARLIIDRPVTPYTETVPVTESATRSGVTLTVWCPGENRQIEIPLSERQLMRLLGRMAQVRDAEPFGADADDSDVVTATARQLVEGK